MAKGRQAAQHGTAGQGGLLSPPEDDVPVGVARAGDADRVRIAGVQGVRPRADLVAIGLGDLSYLHVHPDDAAATDGVRFAMAIGPDARRLAEPPFYGLTIICS